jgi:hypothetical protein
LLKSFVVMSAQPFFDKVSKLRDASITSPSDAQTLSFRGVDAKWENLTVTSSTEGLWNFSTTLGMADPGSGKLRLNNATVSAATQMAISIFTQPGTDVTRVLKALGTGDQIVVQDRSNAANWIRYTVGGAPTNNATWFLIPVAFVSGSGTTSGNNNLLVVSFQSTGPGGGGGGTGTVTNFSAGNLGPLFSTSVANPSTTPNLSFSLSTAGAHAFLGNNTGSIAAPTYVQPGFSDLSGTLDLGGAQASGTLAAGREPAHTGDVTNSAGSLVLALVNIPDITPAPGSILHTNIAAPTNPAAGKTKLYVDSTSKNLAAKNDAGTVNHGIQSRTATASNWIRGVADDGTTAISQPAFSDISGAASPAQAGLPTGGTATQLLSKNTATNYDASWISDLSTATLQTVSATPTGTTSATGVMAGLAGLFTPVRSGKVCATISGRMSNNTAGNQCACQMRYGTGAAPANGAAPTGTAVGGVPVTLSATALAPAPFSVTSIITGLALGTQIWFDLTQSTASTTGTAGLFAVSIAAFELP